LQCRLGRRLLRVTFNFTFLRNVSIDLTLVFYDRAAGEEIINPIQSARMVTSDSFSLTYGTIEIRAKMPKGDWIWPGIYE